MQVVNLHYVCTETHTAFATCTDMHTVYSNYQILIVLEMIAQQADNKVHCACIELGTNN